MQILFFFKKRIQLGTMRNNGKLNGVPVGGLLMGVILFRNGFDCKIIKKVIDPNGRYISIEVQINDEKYFLLNVYGPNNDNKAVQFYDHLIAVLRKEGLAYKDKIIIGGDFNCPINPLLDKQSGILVLRKKVVEHIEEIHSNNFQFA